MTSLADILYGNIPTEADYLSQDPFYRSGLGISQIQTAAPRNNTEAFLVPFLQNAVAGGLAGYGRSNAAQSAFTDARTSLAPLLSQVGAAQQANPDFAVPSSIAPFLSETMPEDFKIKDALQARAMAQYQQQITQEVAAKRQELVDKAAVEGGQPFLDAVKKKAQMEAQGTALGKREGEGGWKSPENLMKEADTARSEIGKIPSVQTYLNMASAIKKIDSIADLDSKTSDIPFTYALIQSQDGGVVKDGERFMVQGSSPLLERFGALLEGALNGTSELTPAIKRQLVEEMKQQHAGIYDQALADAQPRIDIAKRRGVLDDADLLPFAKRVAEGGDDTGGDLIVDESSYTAGDAAADGYSPAEIETLRKQGWIK